MIHAPAGRRTPAFAGPVFSVDATLDDVATTLAVRGSFEREHCAAVERALKAAICEPGGIVIDLRSAHHVDASAIILLIGYKRALGEHLQIIVSESGAVRRILEISGLSRKLAITTEAATARTLLLAAAA